jgi:hypothetical protein
MAIFSLMLSRSSGWAGGVLPLSLCGILKKNAGKADKKVADGSFPQKTHRLPADWEQSAGSHPAISRTGQAMPGNRG